MEFEKLSAKDALAAYWGNFSVVPEPVEPENLATEGTGASEAEIRPPVSEEVQAFTAAIVLGVEEQQELIDTTIREASTNWRLDRMACVDKNILRIATYELRFRDDVPRKVSLNEAIEIAKKYGSDDSSAFINGILDRISQSTEQSS